jgi:hypothetical protein
MQDESHQNIAFEISNPCLIMFNIYKHLLDLRLREDDARKYFEFPVSRNNDLLKTLL